MSLLPKPSSLSPAEEAVRSLIDKDGPLTFARFMELALFSPHGGYYSSPEAIGSRGDYFTSPTLHPAFAALLAIQLEQMWTLLGCPAPFLLVEIGAGKGQLCHDLLAYARSSLPRFHQALRLVALDRLPPHPPVDNDVARVTAVGIPFWSMVGCFLSNELLDSLPVHRVVVQRGRLLEVYVTVKDGQLQETLAEPSTPRLDERFRSLGVALPEGYRTEVNLALEDWMAEVAQTLARGYVLTIDYGYPAEELYNAARSRGTLRCYFKHTLSANPYQRVGRQDMTAHVDFTSLMRAGEARGLGTLGFTTQREFLLNLGLEAFLEALDRMGLARRELEANRIALLELAKADGLGNFRVLAQGKGVPDEPLWGFTPANARQHELKELASQGRFAVPLRTPQHIPLWEARDPSASFDWEALWKELQS
ncbi:MAG: SAM-dependent methyltransferase [Chloroflexi bacterium]|nr:SAM-dependent methyltransferase [Chloroflexota bacterium]